MAAMTRLLRTSKPLDLDFLSSSSLHHSNSSSSILRYSSKAGTTMTTSDYGITERGERRSTVSAKALVALAESVTSSSEPKTEAKSRIDIAADSLVLSNVIKAALKILIRPAVKQISWKLHTQLLIDKVIIDCRFFTLFAVMGSLFGSILCFIEGCFLVLKSYFRYFRGISQHPDQGQVVQLLIEAIDMFLVGTAILIFGMGLYVQFVGSKGVNGRLLPQSNFFGLFHLKRLPAWAKMQSVSQAKSKIGHAVLMILQVGVLEKFKNIPLVTGFDLACFSGAILVSSACVFLLSRLSMN